MQKIQSTFLITYFGFPSPTLGDHTDGEGACLTQCWSFYFFFEVGSESLA